MKSLRGQLHSFLTSALDGFEWLTSRLGRVTSGKNHRTHWRGVWIGPSDGPDGSGDQKIFLRAVKPRTFQTH